MDPSRSVLHDLDLTPELLARQGRSLRNLARRLLGDAHEAEDVVQDTWLATLQQGATIRGRLSGWLARVTRNRSLQLQRGAARRRNREHDAARPEPLDADPEALAAREEALRAVTGALLELDETYRVVLLLRYYEDRAPIEIARALGLPPTTVKSRLERGLELLRARLEARGHGRRGLPGLALLAGRARGTVTGPASLGTGTLVMASKLAIVAASAAVVGGLALFWSEPAEPAPQPIVQASARRSGLAPDGSAGLLDPSSAPEANGRLPLAEEAQAVEGDDADAGAEAFPQSLAVTVRDALGLPLPGASVRLGFRGGRMQSVGTTGRSGSLETQFFTRTARADLLVEIADGDRPAVKRELSFETGQPVHIDMGLLARSGPEAVTSSRLRVRTLGDRLVSGTSRLGTRRSLVGSALQDVFTFEEPPSSRPCPREAPPATDGALQVLALAGGDGDGLRVRSVLRLESGPWELAVESEPDPGGPTATVRGCVRNARGELVPGAVLAVAAGEDPLRWHAFADDRGRFEIEVPAERPLRLRAGGGAVGLDETSLTPRPDEVVTWDALLTRGTEISGRLVDPSGDGLGGRTIELVRGGPGELWTVMTETLADGSFALPNVPLGTFDLVVLSGSGLPCKTVPRVSAGEDLGTLVMSASELARGSLEVLATGVDGLPVPGALRVFSTDSRRALDVRELVEEGQPAGMRVEGLPAGRYEVELITGVGERDLGSVWLDPGAALDLGEVRLDPTALLTLAPDPNLEQTPLELHRLHSSVESRVAALRPGDSLSLRAGRYVLEGLGQRVEFELGPGAVSAWAIDPGDPRRIVPGDAPALSSTPDCATCH